MAELSEIEGPHWELVTLSRACTLGGPAPSKCFLAPYRYVLLPEGAEPRAGWLCLVRGRLLEGPNAWKRPAVEAERIVPLLPVSWAMRRRA